MRFSAKTAWQNSRHLATPPLVFPRNDVWETNAERPYYWRVTTQIWVMFLIGWSKLSANKKLYSDLGSVASLWNFFARFSGVFRGETNGDITKCGSAAFLGYDKKETRFLFDQPSTFVAVTIVIFAHLCWIYSIIVEICFTNFRRKFGYCLNGFKFAYRFRKL